jgi:hypothetical protein
MSDGYTVDTDELRTAARTHLDGLASDLEAARSKIVSTEKELTAFAGGGHPGELFVGLAPRFEETTYYLDRVLQENTENLRLSADALREIANRYDENEQEAIRRMPS